MSAAGFVILIIVVLAIVALAIVTWLATQRRSLQKRFGPEYARVAAEQPNRAAAEHELRDRERKHAKLELRPLTPEARARYAAEWSDVQARFVDSPSAVVQDCDALVTRLITDIGYPTAGADERLAMLSVDYARTLGRYRDAHEISLRNARGEASTEELRQALVHYRTLFAELLGDEPDLQSGEPVAAASVASGQVGDGANTPTAATTPVSDSPSRRHS
jgi:hypothetical protein